MKIILSHVSKQESTKLTPVTPSNYNRFSFFSLADSAVNLQSNGY